jgi:hypothetical protein
MNTASYSHPQFIAACPSAVFSALREKLTIEVSGSAKLAELLEKVSLMQKAQANPVEFKRTFLEFVDRAQEHLDAVQSFFPTLVIFLPPPQYASRIADRIAETPLHEMQEM